MYFVALQCCKLSSLNDPFSCYNLIIYKLFSLALSLQSFSNVSWHVEQKSTDGIVIMYAKTSHSSIY
jgi:hypothetical protein